MNRRRQRSELLDLCALQRLREVIAAQDSRRAEAKRVVIERRRDDMEKILSRNVADWDDFWTSDERNPLYLGSLAAQIEASQARLDLAEAALADAKHDVRTKAIRYGQEAIRSQDFATRRRRIGSCIATETEHRAILDDLNRRWRSS